MDVMGLVGPNKKQVVIKWSYCGVPYKMAGLYIPGTQMTSMFEGQPPKTRPFPIKTGVIWVVGIYIYTCGFGSGSPLWMVSTLVVYMEVVSVPLSCGGLDAQVCRTGWLGVLLRTNDNHLVK